MPGQPQLHSTTVLGIDATAIDFTDPNGTPSQYIIKANVPFAASVSFKVGDTFAGSVLAIGVPYTVSIYLNALGSGVSGQLATVLNSTVPVPPPMGSEYQYDLTLPCSWPNVGLYRTTAIVHFTTLPMTAFVEGPIIEIF